MRRILGPALVAALLHALLLGGYAAAHGDLASLVCVGQERVGRPPYEAIHLGIQQSGYDGQFYYALARDPWRAHRAGIDLPAFRHLRVLYPAAGWLLSGGDARRLLWVLPLINLLAIAGLAGFGATLARGRGLSPWWGVLLPVAVNAGLAALRDLTDVVSLLAACGLLVTWLRGGPWWALALWSAAALLSREQNLLVVLTVGLGVLHRGRTAAGRRDLPLACLGLAAALALWGAWVVALRVAYGDWPLLPTGPLFGVPLAGMLARLSAPEGGPRLHLLHLLCIALILTEVGLTAYLLCRRPDGVVALATVAGAGMAVLGGYQFYADYWSYMRVFALLPLGVWLLSVQARWRAPLVLLSTQALLPVGAVVRALLR